MTAGLGYLGIVGSVNKCGEGALAPLIFPGGAACQSFEDSPYGIVAEAGTALTVRAYLIDEATLDIAVGSPITPPSGSSAGLGGIVLDDSTIVFEHDGVGTSEWYSVNRSGLSLSIDGPQVSVASLGPAGACRIDSTRFAYAYGQAGGAPGSNAPVVVRFCSVSGGVISVDSSVVIQPPNAIVTDQDTGVLTSIDFRNFAPFHYDSSTGLMYFFTEVGFFEATYVVAVPYTTGGGIGSVLPPTARAFHVPGLRGDQTAATKIGTSECVLVNAFGQRVPFYDDGTHMQCPSERFSPTPDPTYRTSILPVTHHGQDGADNDGSWGNYLIAGGEAVAGSGVDLGPCIATQSGVTLSYTPITPIFQCPGFGTEIGGISDGARHGSNLGAVCLLLSGEPDFNTLLRAFKW